MGELDEGDLEGVSIYQFRQTILLLLIGELYGLNTFKKILSSVDITSKNCYKVWGKFSYQDLYDLISQGFVEQLKERLNELCQLGESSWSRAEVTIIIDETIFKTWLNCRFDDDKYAVYYGKYFSGQTHKSEYGFRFSLTGVSVNDEFYPLFFTPIKKESKCEQEAVSKIKKVENIFLQCAKNQHFKIPSISFSVDGGYNKEDLIIACDELSLKVNFICVPRKNNIVRIGSFEGSLSQYIEQEFLVKEKETNSNQPFYIRVRGFYKSKNREVVFLFFRLNKSNKVSVIYSTNLSIKAKTMRRRWFHRTKIENYFRILKDTLKIQQSTADSTDKFFKKVMLFSIKAVFIKKFENYCRKHYKAFKNLTFWKLREKIIYSQCDLSIIFDQLERCAFCRLSTIQRAKYQYFRTIGKSPI